MLEPFLFLHKYFVPFFISIKFALKFILSDISKDMFLEYHFPSYWFQLLVSLWTKWFSCRQPIFMLFKTHSSNLYHLTRKVVHLHKKLFWKVQIYADHLVDAFLPFRMVFFSFLSYSSLWFYSYGNGSCFLLFCLVSTLLLRFTLSHAIAMVVLFPFWK